MNTSVGKVKMYKRRLEGWKFREAILQPWEIYSVYYGLRLVKPLVRTIIRATGVRAEN